MSESMFPAPAGMSPEIEKQIHDTNDVPRTRGDEPWDVEEILCLCKCSPHPRG